MSTRPTNGPTEDGGATRPELTDEVAVTLLGHLVALNGDSGDLLVRLAGGGIRVVSGVPVGSGGVVVLSEGFRLGDVAADQDGEEYTRVTRHNGDRGWRDQSDRFWWDDQLPPTALHLVRRAGRPASEDS